MDKIERIILKPMLKSQYVQPLTIHYYQNKKKKSSPVLDIYGSVSILMYNVTRQVFVFVKQFRPAVYFAAIPEEDKQGEIDIKKYPITLGMTLEMCAGLIDKKATAKEIARDEIFEECGYNVPVENLEKIVSCPGNVLFIGKLQTVFYCEIQDYMRINTTRIESETIDVIEMNVEETKAYLREHSKNSPSSLLFAFYWFLCNKYKGEEK